MVLAAEEEEEELLLHEHVCVHDGVVQTRGSTDDLPSAHDEPQPLPAAVAAGASTSEPQASASHSTESALHSTALTQRLASHSAGADDFAVHQSIGVFSLSVGVFSFSSAAVSQLLDRLALLDACALQGLHPLPGATVASAGLQSSELSFAQTAALRASGPFQVFSFGTGTQGLLAATDFQLMALTLPFSAASASRHVLAAAPYADGSLITDVLRETRRVLGDAAAHADWCARLLTGRRQCDAPDLTYLLLLAEAGSLVVQAYLTEDDAFVRRITLGPTVAEGAVAVLRYILDATQGVCALVTLVLEPPTTPVVAA
eukprot:1934820-Prymnesium_polylepis.1